MLKAGHELAVEAAQRVACEEAVAPLGQVLVDLGQLRQQRVLRSVVLLQQHQFEFLHLK